MNASQRADQKPDRGTVPRPNVRSPNRAWRLPTIAMFTIVAIASTLIATGAWPVAGAPTPPTATAPDSSAHAGAPGPLSAHPAISATIQVTPSTTDVGLPVTIRATVSGASGNFSLSYSGLPAGCSSDSAFLLACTPSWPGNYTVSVSMVNTTGATASASAALRVDARPSVASFTASPASITIGQSTYIRVVPTGGTPPVTVLEYSGLPVGCASSAAFQLSCQPSVPGTFSLSVLLADSLGVAAGSNTTLTVTPTSGGTGGAIRISSFTAFPNPLELGSSTNLIVSASGGNGSLYYSYSGLPPGCADSNTASLGCVPSQAGNFTVTAAVQDRLGDSSWAELVVTVVNSLPSSSNPGGPSVLGFWTSPGEISLGETTVLQVLATGGTPPLSYLYEGLPVGCQSASVSALACTPNVAGPVAVQVILTDAVGIHASATTYFVVNGPTSSTVVPGSPPTLDLTWLGAFGPGIAVGAVAVLVAVVVAGRGRAPPPPMRPAERRVDRPEPAPPKGPASSG